MKANIVSRGGIIILAILATLCMARFECTAPSEQTSPTLQQHNTAIQKYNTTSSVCRHGLDDCYFANGREGLVIAIDELTQDPHRQISLIAPGKSWRSDALALLRRVLNRLKPSDFTTGTNFSESDQQRKDREDAAWLTRSPLVRQNSQFRTTMRVFVISYVPRLEALVLPSGAHEMRALFALRYAKFELYAIPEPDFRPVLNIPPPPAPQEYNFYQELELADGKISNALKRSAFGRVALPAHEK